MRAHGPYEDFAHFARAHPELFDFGFVFEHYTPTGLRWSSSRGPGGALSAGTTATARIAVERRRPIAFVLPALRSTAGVD